MQRGKPARYPGEYPANARFPDYCPNGLRVEGRTEMLALVRSQNEFRKPGLTADASHN
ncbi:MAG: hypothetical protein HY066_06320 [Betaproteobacteria bacterium]|nr:hypothetical protein [Betaproteobacteria bacterium]